MKGSGLRQNAQCTACRSVISRPRSPGCRSNPASTSTPTSAGETLYVGKARVLRDRVRSYLGAHGMSPRIDALLDEAQRLEVIVTDSVVEALALENHLIKQRAPKYNILLRDDKNYPVPAADDRRGVPARAGRAPRRARRPLLRRPVPAGVAGAPDDVADATSCSASGRATRSITGERGRPCLEYDIKRCIAPCVARALLGRGVPRRGRAHAAVPRGAQRRAASTTLRERMTEAAGAERFEQAAQLRDAIRTIETLRTRQQKMAGVELGDRDAFGLKLGPAGAVVQVFQMRGGRVVERIELVIGRSAPRRVATPGDRRRRGRARQRRDATCCRRRCSSSTPTGPRRRRSTCRSPFSDADTELLEGWLSGAAGRRVRLVVPQARREARPARPRRAQRRGRLSGALQRERRRATTTRSRRCAPCWRCRRVPRRIECFDISTIQGSETVASMVVCEDGRMKRSEYRKFRIRGSAARDSAARRSELGVRRSAWRKPAPAAARVGESTAARARAAERRASSASAGVDPEPADAGARVRERGDRGAERRDPRRLRLDARSRAAPLPQAARDRRAVPGPDPDRRRQGAAVGGLRGARGARAGTARGGRHREEGGAALHARPRGRDRAARRRARRCC